MVKIMLMVSFLVMLFTAWVKALVWFWLFNETLSANLVYQSGHEIGNTILSGGAKVKIMMMVWSPW